jgi:aspartate aminotransferase-like enzyme
MPAIVPIVAATAGISLIRRVGVDVIERRVVELAHQVITCCVDAGLDPITPDASASHAGVVAVRTPRAVEIASMGRRSGVDVGGYPWGLLRIDPHAYVVDADVRRLQEVFASVL